MESIKKSREGIMEWLKSVLDIILKRTGKKELKIAKTIYFKRYPWETDKPKMIKYKTLRKWYTNKSTIGELYVNAEAQHRTFTLEDMRREPGIKVDKQTCIPGGLYKVRITWSPRFKTYMPLIYNTKDLTIEAEGIKFDGVRIHKGNKDTDTDACLLVGNLKGIDEIYDSKNAYESFYTEMEKELGIDKYEADFEIVDHALDIKV